MSDPLPTPLGEIAARVTNAANQLEHVADVGDDFSDPIRQNFWKYAAELRAAARALEEMEAVMRTMPAESIPERQPDETFGEYMDRGAAHVDELRAFVSRLRSAAPREGRDDGN
jgi:hypothetical protein